MNQKMTVSFAKGNATETSIRHNNRSLDPDHFDYDKAGHRHILPEYTSLNEVLVHRDIKKVYQEQFGKAVEQYNAKQKRKDRRITDYYRKIKNSKNQATQREFIVQVGNQNDYLKQDRTTSKNWQTAKKILTEFEHDFEQNNPNLQVYNAVIHMDEPGSPHLHLNVVPVAHLKNAQRGITVKPSFDKALIEEGFKPDPKDSRALFREFQHQQADNLTELAHKFGIEREQGLTNQLKNVHEYKQAMRAVDQAQALALQQKNKNAELAIKLTDQKIMSQELDQQIKDKQQKSAILSRESHLKVENGETYLKTLKLLSSVNNDADVDYYLPTKSFGLVDKVTAQARIAELIKKARLSQNLVQVIQQNQKLTATNTQLQTQIQKLTLENETIADKKSLEGYHIGIKKGRHEEKQRVHVKAGEPYQKEIKSLNKKIAEQDNYAVEKVMELNKLQSDNLTYQYQIKQLQEQLDTVKIPYQEKIATLTTELQDQKQQNQAQKQQLAQKDQVLHMQANTIKRQKHQIKHLQQFGQTLVTAIGECKPLLKNTWSKVVERIGQHFHQQQEPDLDLFKQYWPQTDFQTLKHHASTPSKAELYQLYLQHNQDMDLDR